MSQHENNIFQEGLQRHLWKSELEYRAKWLPGGSCVDWLAPMCNSTGEIAAFLRELGFKIRCVVDEKTTFGDYHRWVITTSGIVVFVNFSGVEGFVTGPSHDRR